MKIKKENLLFLMFLYMYIPIIIFLFGFVKFYFAIPTFFVILFVFGEIFKDTFWGNFLHNLYDKILNKKNVINCNIKNNTDYLEIKLTNFFIILGIFAFVMWTMGYGGFKEQPIDWYKHNGITIDLIKKTWPVYYSNGNEHSMLSYYICGYMLSSLIGKIFGSYNVTYFVTYIYVLLGVFLVYLYLLLVLKVKKSCLQFGLIFVFLFILGFQEIGKYIVKIIKPEDYTNVLNYFFYNDKYQYSNAYTLIRWVPYQSTIAFITMLIFLNYKKDIKYYIFIGLPCIMYSAFSFVGIVIYMVVYAIYLLIKNKDFVSWLKNIFSIYNILIGLTLGVIVFFYLEGNFLAEKPDYMQFYIRAIDRKYFFFVICMVLPYYMILFQKYRKDLLFYITYIGLFILPLTSMGVFNDFMMRVSIPFLFIQTMMVMDVLNNFFDKNDNKFFDNIVFENKVFDTSRDVKDKMLIIYLIVCLVCGSITPIKEIVKNLKTEGKGEKYDTMQVFANRNGKIAEMGLDTLVYNYFAYDIDEKVFYKYIARVKDMKYKKIKGGKMDTTKKVK